jgi:hypothetical protein
MASELPITSRPRSSAEMISAYCPVSGNAKGIIRPDANAEYLCKAVVVDSIDFKIDGSFILTNKRYLFGRRAAYKDENMGSISSGVRLEYDYVVGLMATGLPGISSHAKSEKGLDYQP